MLSYELHRMTRTELQAVLRREGMDLSKAMDDVAPVIRDVKNDGDSALLRYAEKLDGFRGRRLTLTRREMSSATSRVPKELLDAIAFAKKRIEAFHSRQVLKPFSLHDSIGTVGQKVVPLSRVGVYVPGGTADYVSTVLMACIPAMIAGVKEIAICTPGRGGSVPDSVLAAAQMCGVDEIHPVGGPQSIAAMAYGTESVRKVQKIVGPGGRYVSAAKLLVRNDCEIDFLAGPSEILIIADAQADPEMIAADMLAQLEHDPFARAVLLTDSKGVAERARKELEWQLAKASRCEIAAKAADKGAVFVIVRSVAEAVELSNEFAPEHLLLDVKEPTELLSRIENAGSVFLGSYSSVAFGDYCTGTNHILPTRGAAMMKSSLTVYDFLKVIPYQRISEKGAVRLAGIVEVMARHEGLPAHAEAASVRARRLRT